MGGGAYLPFQIFAGENVEFYFSFFLNVVSYQGNVFKFFPGPNKAILELKNRKWVQKSTIFGQIDIRVLVILGVKKVESKKILGKNAGFFFLFFLNVFSYQGTRF